MPHCRTDGQSLTCGRGLLPPAGQQPPPGAKIQLKINFIYIKVPTARQDRKYISVKNDFEKYKNKKNAWAYELRSSH